MKNPFRELETKERCIYILSLVVVVVSNFFAPQIDFVKMAATVGGVTALIFIAKGNVWGQVITVLFGILYSIAALKTRYYSEIITYLGMTAPIAIFSIVTWIKNPYEKGKNVVKIRALTVKEFFLMLLLTAVVTVVFYFILSALATPNIIVSTISIATSFAASYLMLRRISYYAIAFALNDIVLIILWSISVATDLSSLSMVACFSMFLLNDLYAFIRWKVREKQQRIQKK